VNEVEEIDLKQKFKNLKKQNENEIDQLKLDLEKLTELNELKRKTLKKKQKKLITENMAEENNLKSKLENNFSDFFEISHISDDRNFTLETSNNLINLEVEMSKLESSWELKFKSDRILIIFAILLHLLF